MTTYLSEHFTLEEATHSDTAIARSINNSAPPELISILRITAAYMEVVRGILGSPITINSFYRSVALNAALGSKETSQHRKGEAVDFVCPAFGTPLAICKRLMALQSIIPYDQLILEHTWVHISFAVNGIKPKRQVISLLDSGSYATGLTDKKGNPL